MAECRGLAPHSPFGSPLFSKQVRPARPVDIPNLSAWGAHARKLVHPAGLPPANSPFEAEDDHNFTTDAKLEPAERLALSRGRDPAVYKTAAVAAEPRRQDGGSPRCCPVLCGFKRPLHRCHACNPKLVRRRGVAPGRSVWKTDMLLFNITTAKLESHRSNAPRSSGLQPAPFACSVAGLL